MTAQDQLLRFNFDQLDIRGELVYLNNSWIEVLNRFDYPPNVQKQLGAALAALVLLSATIKYDGNMILQVQGDGPLTKVVVQVTHNGEVRGLARWEGLVPDGTLAEVFGNGHILISVIKDVGERYQSIVALEGLTLADALNVYFLQSEQLPSTFQLLVTPGCVAGFFLQLLPDSRTTREQLVAEGADHTMTELQDREEDWNRINILASTLEASELLNLPPTQLLTRLFHEEQVSVHLPKPLRFSCTCSREKVENTLITLGLAEVEDILQVEGKVEVDCEFCQQRFVFNRHEVSLLFAPPGAAIPPDGVVH
ncbi:MAG: Hsp33 family molecular chaperone HslO [Gammaproteobacteria bacterium]